MEERKGLWIFEEWRVQGNASVIGLHKDGGYGGSDAMSPGVEYPWGGGGDFIYFTIYF